MKRLHRFLRLRPTEKWFLIKAALLLEAIMLALRLLPFRVLRRLTGAAERLPAGLWRTDRFSVQTVGWAIEMLSRSTLGEKTCLAQALAGQVMLVRRGYPAILHIGVLKTEEGTFQAHAWVESEGNVVVGGHELERYVTITTLDGSKAWAPSGPLR